MKLLTAFILSLLCACTPKEQKVLYINSYHTGYVPSDQVEAAITRGLDGDITLRKFYLDAKRLSADEVSHKADDAWAMIVEFKPDLVIVSDDNAVQRVIVPNVATLDMPVLYCGVNWSAEKYALPSNKVSGILEILPVENCINALRESGQRPSSITVLSENSLGEEKNKTQLVPLFESMGLTVHYVMVDDFVAWQHEFANAQRDGNIVFLPTNGAITGWNKVEAIEFVIRETRVPTFTCDDFMIDYAVFGIMKIAAEQGEWIAAQSRRILKGEKISAIPSARNRRFECILNERLSGVIGLRILSKEFTCKSQTNAN